MKRDHQIWPVLAAVLVAGFLFAAGFSIGEGAEDNDDYERFFDMDQDAGSTGGTTKRNIDISSPFSGAYLYENMTVVGSAEIRESFRMGNIDPGPGAGSVSGDRKVKTGSGPDDSPGSGPGINPDPAVKSNPGSEGEDNPASGAEDYCGLKPVKIPAWSDLF